MWNTMIINGSLVIRDHCYIKHVLKEGELMLMDRKNNVLIVMLQLVCQVSLLGVASIHVSDKHKFMCQISWQVHS